MKKYPLLFLFSIIIVIFQQAIFSRIQILGVTPDIVFVYIVCFSILREDSESVIIALFTGIIRDCFFPVAFGINTVAYILTAFGVSFIQKSIYKDSLLIPVFFTFIATYIKGMIYFSYFYLVSYKYDFAKYALDIIMLESFFNSFLSIFAYKLIHKYDSINILKQDWKF